MTAPSPPAAPGSTDGSVKETLESIVIAFILAFVFRAYVVEAFVIPTGSMAPTLLGEHYGMTCDQCGYRFTVDGPDQAYRTMPAAVCPMCHYPNPMPARARRAAGDRILVHKYIYAFSEPRRWDVVVFKAPHDPNTNYIKRLVGLPQEQLAIVEGNVYTRPTAGVSGAGGASGASGVSGVSGASGGAGQPWRIARKTENLAAQRAVWQPIYHSQYVPLDQGTNSPGRGSNQWRNPWVAQRDWRFDQRTGWTFSGTGGEGVLQFDWSAAEAGGPGLYPYNQLKTEPDIGREEPIEDIRLAAVALPRAPGVTLSLHTTARLDGAGAQPLVARIGPDGTCELLTVTPDSIGGVLTRIQGAPTANVGAWQPGRARSVELWYVDQEASLWVDGRRVLAWSYELVMGETLAGAPLVTRPAPPRRPQVRIEASGGELTLERIELDRDVFYTPHSANDPTLGWGALRKWPAVRPGFEGEPVALGVDEFFVLGDNSPHSLDGRFWPKVNPWILARHFDEQHPHPHGIVPRRLLIGRAFFVYFPAPLRWSPDSAPIVPGARVPDFGSMRFIH